MNVSSGTTSPRATRLITVRRMIFQRFELLFFGGFGG